MLGRDCHPAAPFQQLSTPWLEAKECKQSEAHGLTRSVFHPEARRGALCLVGGEAGFRPSAVAS